MPFATPYQRWYSEVKVLIKQLLPDRLVDFVQHYEKPKSRTSEYLPIRDLSVSINPRRKAGLYRPRVLGQWFDGIRFYAAASSPTRSRRT